MDSLLKFAKSYVKSMRLYYAFITGISGWVGVSFYEYVTPVHNANIQVMPSVEKKLMILMFLFMCWEKNHNRQIWP